MPEFTTLSSIQFQTVGAAIEKARLAKTIRVRGTVSLGAWLDRSGDRSGRVLVPSSAWR